LCFYGVVSVFFTILGFSGFMGNLNVGDMQRRIGEEIPGAEDLNLIPWPQSVERGDGDLPIDQDTRIVIEDVSLNPLGDVLAEEIKMLTELELPVEKEASARPGDIVLNIDPSMEEEQYHLEVVDRTRVSGGSYNGVAAGTVTLLQSLQLHGEAAKLPVVDIVDEPYASYRGFMLDPARHFHTPEMLKDVINLCRWYKIRYLQLHLTDNQSFTFPSQAYPELPTPDRHYTLEQLHELEEYATERGVVIIPELDMPGHGRAVVEARPELFATETGSRSTMNYAKPEVGEALDTIIGEMLDVFRSTPYFHIGADEVEFDGLEKDPDFQAAMEETGLGNVEELYRKFIVDRNETVREHKKQMIVWEGFRRGREVEISHNILVMSFEGGHYYRADHLVGDGYTVINASWRPLYVVRHRRSPVEEIYGWNMYKFDNFAPRPPIQLSDDAPVLGAQMCSWENPQEIVIPGVRERLAAMSERIWHPGLQRDFKHFSRRLLKTDERIDAFTDH